MLKHCSCCSWIGFDAMGNAISLWIRSLTSRTILPVHILYLAAFLSNPTSHASIAASVSTRQIDRQNKIRGVEQTSRSSTIAAADAFCSQRA